MSIIQGTSKSSAATFEISQSVRFNDGDSPYLYRSPSGAGSATTMTWSYWVKRAANFGANNWMWGSYSSPLQDSCFFNTSDQLNFSIDVGGSRLTTTRLFVDPGAWFHVVLVWDSSNGTSGERMRMYINGVRQTDFSTETYPSLGASAPRWNTTTQMEVGRSGFSGQHGDMYMAEFNFLDGIAVTDASDFGQTDSATGQWVPIQYSGSYGSNGFRLQGSDSSDLGEDTSGNGNDFTSSGLTSADSVPDSPTPSADSAIGNRATLMSIQDGSATMSEGNTRFSNSGGTRIQRTTNQPLVGKTYWEVLVNNATQNTAGVSSDQISKFTNDTFYNQTTLVAGFDNANFYYNGSFTTYSQPSASQRWMFAYDADTGELWSGVNGTWHNSGNPAAGTGEVATLSTSYKWFPFIGGKSGADQQIIWGASNMSHTVPTGFTADLSTYRQPDPSTPDPSAYFQSTLYTGDGSGSNEINQTGNSNFEPSMVWIKSRSAATDHVIQDQVRGNFVIYPNQASAEGATGGGWVSSFDSDGFTVASNGPINASGETFVGWQWKANGAGSTDSSAGLSATVSANATAGFSIIKYQGSGSATTVPHQLGVAPKMVIVKDRDNSRSWNVYHDGLSAATKVIYLDQAAAESTDSAIFGSAPTSSVVNIGTGGGSNGSGNDYVMYAFAEVDGYSRISSFVGNGSTAGPFVWTGFRPAFIIFKNISAASQSWEIFDAKRDGFNDANRRLYPNTSEVEPAASDRVRLTSNGFKIVTSGGTHVNGSGNTIIYYAVAESPFKFANSR